MRYGPILIGLALILVVGGVIVSAVGRARDTSDRTRSLEHLRVLGSEAVFLSALPGERPAESSIRYFPAGTVVVPGLAPDQRLSWISTLLPALTQPQGSMPAPKGKARAPAWFAWHSELDATSGWKGEKNRRIGANRIPVLLSPGSPAAEMPEGLAPTQYVGNGGIGANTPALSIDEAGQYAGVFRYDTITLRVGDDGKSEGDIRDGLAATISLAEVRSNLGPWTAGGPATVRTIRLGETALFGVDRPFGGCYPDGGYFSFADGRASFVTDSIVPAILAAQLTIRGGEAFEE